MGCTIVWRTNAANQFGEILDISNPFDFLGQIYPCYRSIHVICLTQLTQMMPALYGDGTEDEINNGLAHYRHTSNAA